MSNIVMGSNRHMGSPLRMSPSLYKHEFYQEIALRFNVSYASAIYNSEKDAWVKQYVDGALNCMLNGETPSQRWVNTFRKRFHFWWDKWSKEYPDLMIRLDRENIWLFPMTKREKFIKKHGEDAYRASKRLASREYRERNGLSYSVQLLNEAMKLIKKHEFELDYEHTDGNGNCNFCIECNGKNTHTENCALNNLLNKYSIYLSQKPRNDRKKWI